MTPHSDDDPGNSDLQLNGQTHTNGVESQPNGHANGHTNGSGHVESPEPLTNGYTNGNGHVDAPQTNGHSAQSPSEPHLNGAAPQKPLHNPRWNPIQKSNFLHPTDSSDVHDLLCVGFGPASLAIAIAMHDKLSSGTATGHSPRVLFLEKQPRFAWHAGMLLPGAKMQISFMKDLASLRDPRSKFTFLNYVHENGRLIDFINLGTFLPARVEYEDYLRWCAAHFDDVVQYGHQVLSVRPEANDRAGVKIFSVACRDVATGEVSTYRSKNVILAVGGQPRIPKELSPGHPRIIHSSQYAQLVPRILTDRSRDYRVAVVGAGQSAAEIFSNVQGLYPNSKTSLIMRSEFLRPSDDSPL